MRGCRICGWYIGEIPLQFALVAPKIVISGKMSQAEVKAKNMYMVSA